MKINVYGILLIGISAFSSSCSQEKNKENPNFIVNTTVAQPVSDANRKEYSFIAQPFRTTELSFRVGGPIRQFDVFSGNRYAQGDLIAEIDPRDFRIRKERAEGMYLQAKAEFERIERLYEKNNIAASTYEQAKATYISAKTAFDTARNELDDTRLLAPFNGYVGEVYTEKFQDVKAAQPIISYIDIEQLKIEIYVTQDIACNVQSADTIWLCFDSRPDKWYRARVQEVSKGTTQNNLSYLLTALLPNRDGKLLAGMSGKVVFDSFPEGNRNAVSIPLSALCHRPVEGDYVWVVNSSDRKVNRRPIKKGELLPNGYITIMEGLHQNETVAVSGLRFLSDGMQVTTSTKTN